MQPRSKEAAAKLKASEKMQKEAAFAQAIMTDADIPLAEEIDPDEICERFSSRTWRACFFLFQGGGGGVIDEDITSPLCSRRDGTG